MVVNLFYLQSGFLNAVLQVFCIVHLGIAVGKSREVQTGHCQTKGRRLKTLTVPKRLHDKDAGLWGHRCLSTSQDVHNLFHAEAIEELAHPDGIKTTIALGEGGCCIEKVDAVATDALGTLFP